MKKVINICNHVIHKIATNFLVILFTIIVIGMLCMNSIYLYIDKPDFQVNNIWNYIGILVNVIGIIVFIIINKIIELKFSKKNFFTVIIFLIYLIGEIVYLKLVPLKPFSDMYYVTEIASSNFKNQIQYLQTYPNNLPTTIIFYLLLKMSSNNVFIIKLFNVFCNIITIYFAYKIYYNVYKQDNKMVILLGITSISTFLYANNAYNDVIFTLLTTIILYLVTKEEKTKKDIILLVIMSFLQFIIRPVGIILIIAICMYFILKKYDYKMVITIVSMFVIFNLLYTLLENCMIPKSEETQQYPIWSFIQMGINEEEFGFQNSTHSTKWTVDDVKYRINELGVKRLGVLLAKKEYWLWTEGTYQVGRYAFGDGQEGLYDYETPITKFVVSPDSSKIRKALDYMMKGQYFVFILLSFVELVIKDKSKDEKEKEDLLYYFIIGLFCFYLIWEIKSRYIYCLYPIFLILSTRGIEKIKRREKLNGKI